MKQFIITVLMAFILSACTQNSTSSMHDMDVTKGNNEQNITLTQVWDKTFPLSEKVNHEKITFKTQYGFTLAADLYIPKNLKTL